MKVTERIIVYRAILQIGHSANFAISPICRASFAKSKERMRAPARFPVPVISHCLTAPHSSHTELLRNIREMNRIREKRVFSQHSLRALRTITARDESF